MKKICLFLVIVLVLALCGCTSASTGATPAPSAESPAASTSATPAPSAETAVASATPTAEPEVKDLNYKEWEPYFNDIKIDSPSIKDNNLINESKVPHVYVMLPPSYLDGSDKKYPVVYFFHGYSDTPGAFLRTTRNALRSSMMKDGAKEYIMVEVSGYNKYGGSFYVNSPVLGNWEDYVIKEVIPMIDKYYRTIADGNSRGVCGFSMGGFSCLNLALKHPDIFCAVYSMSPGVITPELDTGLKDALGTWAGDKAFRTSYGQAFAYDLSLGDPYYKEPTFDGSEEDNKVIAAWETGFGDWETRIDAYLALNKPLKAIIIAYGTQDIYPWIPKGCDYLSALLTQKNIENTLYTHNGFHSPPADFGPSTCTKFFNQYLAY